MKKTLVLVVLTTVVSMFGCASPSTDDSTDSSEGNFEGSPAKIVERETAAKKKAAEEAAATFERELKSALFAAYKADENPSNLERMYPESRAICGSGFSVSEDTTILDWSVAGMTKLQTKLHQGNYDPDRVLIAERSAGTTKTLDFIVIKKSPIEGDQSICFSRSRIEKLHCTGVSLTKGPTAQQCGL